MLTLDTWLWLSHFLWPGVATGLRASATSRAQPGCCNLDVVAEGVESRLELAALRGRGCGAVQGFLLAPPSPAERVGAMLLAAGPEQRLTV